MGKAIFKVSGDPKKDFWKKIPRTLFFNPHFLQETSVGETLRHYNKEKFSGKYFDCDDFPTQTFKLEVAREKIIKIILKFRMLQINNVYPLQWSWSYAYCILHALELLFEFSTHLVSSNTTLLIYSWKKIHLGI